MVSCGSAGENHPGYRTSPTRCGDGSSAGHRLLPTGAGYLKQVADRADKERVEYRPDVVVSWLQNDYGQLGRAAESVAHALQSSGLARQVAYVEPNVAGDGPPTLDADNVRGLHVYARRGAEVPADAVAEAVISTSQLCDPILLNFGVAETNWWFHHAFAPRCRTTALVTHDILHLWPGMDRTASARLARIRGLLIHSSESVIGLSEGAVADVPEATYVGHGCDTGLETDAVDHLAEPADLAPIPHPRALYFGALSVRIEAAALEALASSGVHVVLVGFAPSPAVADLIRTHSHVHFLGPRPPEASPAYLRHCQIGIVPHTDEPFTWSMEPHKVYNYACAGLRSVLLNCACPPPLRDVSVSTTTIADFVAASRQALGAGRLDPEHRSYARTFTWTSVAQRILAAVGQGVADGAVRTRALTPA